MLLRGLQTGEGLLGKERREMKPIEEMTGLELREAVAVGVMGWRLTTLIPGGLWWFDGKRPVASVDDPDHEGPPAYESSIEAAFQVVEKMREKGWCIDFCGWPGQKWEVQIESDEPESLDIDFGPLSFCTADNSLPLAICIAALRAVRAK